jgi:uncharacterized protein (TIGR02453 family)
LEKNNRREWFGPRKELFEQYIHAPMVELVTRLNGRLGDFAPEHVADEPAKLLYRIYRDTRFSKDKTPYKTHLGATFAQRVLPRHGGAGYYFEVSHRCVGIAGGVYGPGPEELEAIRAGIAADAKGFLAVAEDGKLRKLMGALQGQKLARLPKAWQGAAGSPAAEYLKMKQYYWYAELPAATALGPGLEGVLLKYFRAMTGGMQWFNRVILAARAKDAERAEERPAPMW